MLLKKKSDYVRDWVKRAIEKGYHFKDLRRVLTKSGFNHRQILAILSIYEKVKKDPHFIITQKNIPLTIKKMPSLVLKPLVTKEDLQKQFLPPPPPKKTIFEKEERQEQKKDDKNIFENEQKNKIFPSLKLSEKPPSSRLDRSEEKSLEPIKLAPVLIKPKPKGKVIDEYELEIDKAKVTISIEKVTEGLIYNVYFPEIDIATKALLEEIRKELIAVTTLAIGEIVDQKSVQNVKERFMREANTLLRDKVPGISKDTEDFLVGILMQEMLGLGKIEFLINDPNLEEIVIVSSIEVRVYHKKYGWLLTNITLRSEDEVTNYANIIARRVGRQISILNPLLDAHVVTGDRANAVLYPVATKGNTITIRKFSRDPWTIIDLINNNTMSKEIASILWLAMEYEMNVIFSGGTASGKTVCLNACMPFIPPNHRVISMEDTRELMLPTFLYWCPLVTRTSNVEGKGEVSMLDLLVNSLRMRPDRIILGEIRRQREAEVLFEAMHTGHSVYSTVHADTANETIRRLTNPPINIPPSMLYSVNLNLVMFRDRKKGVRRAFQLAEFIPGKESLTANLLYRWIPDRDQFVAHNRSLSFFETLSRNTGMDEKEINSEINNKKDIFDWLIKNKIRDLESFGKLTNLYYTDRERMYSIIKNNKVSEILEKK